MKVVGITMGCVYHVVCKYLLLVLWVGWRDGQLETTYCQSQQSILIADLIQLEIVSKHFSTLFYLCIFCPKSKKLRIKGICVLSLSEKRSNLKGSRIRLDEFHKSFDIFHFCFSLSFGFRLSSPFFIFSFISFFLYVFFHS